MPGPVIAWWKEILQAPAACQDLATQSDDCRAFLEEEAEWATRGGRDDIRGDR